MRKRQKVADEDETTTLYGKVGDAMAVVSTSLLGTIDWHHGLGLGYIQTWNGEPAGANLANKPRLSNSFSFFFFFASRRPH